LGFTPPHPFSLFPSPRLFDSVRSVLAKVYSAAVYGVDAFEVEIEVNGARGNPVIVIMGTNPPEVAGGVFWRRERPNWFALGELTTPLRWSYTGPRDLRRGN
jgi:hypothetical protein